MNENTISPTQQKINALLDSNKINLSKLETAKAELLTGNNFDAAFAEVSLLKKAIETNNNQIEVLKKRLDLEKEITNRRDNLKPLFEAVIEDLQEDILQELKFKDRFLKLSIETEIRKKIVKNDDGAEVVTFKVVPIVFLNDGVPTKRRPRKTASNWHPIEQPPGCSIKFVTADGIEKTMKNSKEVGKYLGLSDYFSRFLYYSSAWENIKNTVAHLSFVDANNNIVKELF